MASQDATTTAADRADSLPHDLPAERSVLGTLLRKPGFFDQVSTTLGADDFYAEKHRAIFMAMVDLQRAATLQAAEARGGGAWDAISVASRLAELKLDHLTEGAAYLFELEAAFSLTASLDHHCRIIAECAQLRSAIAFGQRAVLHAMERPENVPAFLDGLAQEAAKLAASRARQEVQHISEPLQLTVAATEALSESSLKGALTGVTSGFYDLDQKTNGWQRSDLIILAARPAMGKTAFALNMLYNATRDRREAVTGVIFSLEMSRQQLAQRMWAAAAGVPISNLRRGEIEDEEWPRLYAALEELQQLPIYIDDTAAISVTEIARKCRQLKARHNLGVVLIDYLQLMTVAHIAKNTNREQVISEISRGLKALAKELNLPVIALSQLNRGVESRADKRPMVSDLRESGAIEQDADIIVFLYRQDYYDQLKAKQDAEARGISVEPLAAAVNTHADEGADVVPTEVIIAKHRSGPTGTVEVLFQKSATLFLDRPRPGSVPPPTDADRPPHTYKTPSPEPGPPSDEDLPDVASLGRAFDDLDFDLDD